jgi:outer membrane receptor protein involved in Fe transport
MNTQRFVRDVLVSCAALAALAWTLPASAQTGAIQGTIVESTSQRPLTGAQILVVGTGLGTLTNPDGRYLVRQIPAGEYQVRVQLIGYATEEQTVTILAGETSTLNFELGQSAIALDEIVVTGQGRARERKQLATTVDVIDTEQMEFSPAVSVDQLLQGRLAGGTVSATSAQPGTAGLVNFRGVSSVFGSQTPVVYVDGVRVDTDMDTAIDTGGETSSALADLLAMDIDRIEITKGGAASTLYGSDAATGVIQIFTKRGTPGEPRVTARIEQGFDVPELKYILDTGPIFDQQLDPGDYNPTLLQDEYFKTGYQQSYYLGLSGGTGGFTYNVSGRILDATGVQPKNENQLFALRGAVQAEVNERTQVTFSGNYTRSQFGRVFNGTAIADPLTTFEVGDALYFSGESTLEGALSQFLMPNIDEEVSRFLFSTGVSYQPLDYLQTRVSVGLDHRSNLNKIYEPLGYVVNGNPDGDVDRYARDFNSFSAAASASLVYPQTETFENTFTTGVQGFRDDVTTVFASGEVFALPGAPEVDEAAEITASETNSELFGGGVFFEDQVGLWDRLYVNAGIRIDANTGFGDEVSTAAYPKFGVSYLLSQEPAFRDLAGRIFSDLKVRAAYGQTGKFPPPFLRDRTYSAESFRTESAPRFDNPGNADLGPEVTTTFEAGFDAAFLENRVGLNVTWYDATTEDAFFEVPEQPVTGLGTQIRNVGTIANTGWELEGNFQVLNTANTLLQVRASYSTVRNRIEDMGTAAPFWIGGSYQRVCGPPNDCVEGVEGEELPVGTWYVDWAIDTNGDGLLDDSDRFFLCNDGSKAEAGQGCDEYATPFPRHNGSLGMDLTLFNRLTLSGLADWAGGFWAMDWGSIWATFNRVYRREIMEDGYEYPIRYSEDGEDLGPYFPYSAVREFMVDGDYMKLREISARYRAPDQWARYVGADRAVIYASGRNLAIWSRNGVIDPELNGVTSGEALMLGSESSITLSPPRAFRFGIELSF